MRAVFFIALVAVPCVAQQPNLPRPSPPASGHSLPQFDENTPQIAIEVLFISVPHNEYQKLKSDALIRSVPMEQKLSAPSTSDEELAAAGGIRLVSAKTVIEERRPVFVETVNDAEKKRLIQQFQKTPSANVMFAPKVTLFDGQLAEIKDTASRPFVTGLNSDNGKLTPAIQTFEEGTQLAIQVHVRKDKSVRMNIGTRLSQIRQISVANAGRNDAKVQVPKVHKSDIQLSAAVSSGDSIAIWGFQTEKTYRVTKPAFGGIPYISRAFKNTAAGTEVQHILLMITPTVLELNNATD